MGEFIQASYRGSAAVLGVAYIQNIYGNAGMAPLMIIGTVPLYNIAAVLVLSFTGPSSGGLNKNPCRSPSGAFSPIPLSSASPWACWHP